MASLIYQSITLDRAGRNIRLLTIEPGIERDPLVCRLEVASLDDKPPYFALSYVWGDPRDVCQITLNNKPAFITKNLAGALRRLRTSVPCNERLLLWVDAVCIDQSDYEEKSHQIQLMGEIYADCVEVLIYLGMDWPVDIPEPSDNGTSSGNGFVQLFRNTIEENSQYLAQYNEDLTFAKEPSQFNYSLHCACFFYLSSMSDPDKLVPFEWRFDISDHRREYIRRFDECLKFFSENPWFRRLWTLQEVVLAPDGVVIFGQYGIPRHVFVKAADRLGMGPGNLYVTADLLPTFGRIRSILLLFRQFSYQMQLLATSDRSDQLTLIHLAAGDCYRDSSSDLDRLYALLGLVKNWFGRMPLMPEYNRSVSEIYAQATAEHILGSQLLSPLTISSARGVYRDLPSWVIDWTAFRLEVGELHSSNLHYLRAPGYNACNGWMEDLSIYDKRILKVCAIRFGVISLLGALLDVRHGFIKDSLEWGKLCRSHKEDNEELEYITGEDWDEVLLRTMCGDFLIHGNKMSRIPGDFNNFEELMAGWKDVLAFFRTPSQTPEIININVSISRSMEMSLHQRRFFMTEDGFVGVARADIAVGDPVFVLSNSPIPFVLRHTGRTYLCDDDPQPQLPRPMYRVVSDCYVHGIMDGEAIEYFVACARENGIAGADSNEIVSREAEVIFLE